MILESLSSSSRGNCHLLSNGDTTLMLDCGLLYGKMNNSVINKKIDGVLITHEHGDHTQGIRSLGMNKLIKVYGTRNTLLKLTTWNSLKREIEPDKAFEIGNFVILPFEVQHDSVHPVNYLIKDKISGSQFLYITDTGYIDNLTFKDIDYILIECNFDEKWYDKVIMSKTEEIKKTRLMGNRGHLSVQKCVKFLKKIINHNTKKIILCHISRDSDNYIEFEERVKKDTGFKNVTALNPNLISSVVNELKEPIEVNEFE